MKCNFKTLIMKFKQQLALFLLMINAFCAGCSCLQCPDNKLFVVKDAYYQSWVVAENEHGTDIFVEIADIKNGVTFDSIVFRGLRLPVVIEKKDSLVILKCIISTPLSKIFIKNEFVGKPDQLIYHYNGISHSQALKELRRKNMRYYGKASE
jgi:hypothetical protein